MTIALDLTQTITNKTDTDSITFLIKSFKALALIKETFIHSSIRTFKIMKAGFQEEVTSQAFRVGVDPSIISNNKMNTNRQITKKSSIMDFNLRSLRLNQLNRRAQE